MPRLHVVNVFTTPDGSEGNPLGVFLDGNASPESERQSMAYDLGFSETVFVENIETAQLAIYTPTEKLSFAGHPLVGTSWLLNETGNLPAVLRPPVGEVPTWIEGNTTWIRGLIKWCPNFEFIQLESIKCLELLIAPPENLTDAYCWAWEDENAGQLRARNFAPSLGIAEDPATGSAAMTLAANLQQQLLIIQGNGCQLHARIGPKGSAAVGGTTVLSEIRFY